MVIGIAGLGALGGLFAGSLAHAGEAVRVYSRRAPAGISRRLIVREERSEVYSSSVEWSSDPRILEGAYAVLVCAKAYDGPQVALALKEVASCGPVVSLMNGVEAAPSLAAVLGAWRVWAGCTRAAAQMSGDGSIRVAGRGRTVFGPLEAAGSDTGRGNPDAAPLGQALAATLSAAGLPSSFVPDPMPALWEKACLNAALNPVAALFGLANGQVLKDGNALSLSLRALEDAWLVARAHGIALGRDALERSFRSLCRESADNECSMLRDLIRGVPIELDDLVGAFIAMAGRHSLSVPTLRYLYDALGKDACPAAAGAFRRSRYGPSRSP